MSISKILPADELRRLYWNDGKSALCLARKFNCCDTTIFRWMKKYKIPRRSLSEARKLALLGGEAKRKSREMTGQKNPMWGKKGGLHPRYGKRHTERAKEKMRKSALINWANRRYKERMVKLILCGQNIKPNGSERKLIKIIENNNFPFTYVGDGKVVIEGFCPDFIDNDGSKRVIEVFGDYWHNLPEIMKRDEKRLKAYKNYGFETLIIWEHELKDINVVIQKVKEFEG